MVFGVLNILIVVVIILVCCDTNGSVVWYQKARGYVERVLSYVRQYTDHVRNSALHLVAPCTPVWNLFDSARGITCNGIIEPLVSSASV